MTFPHDSESAHRWVAEVNEAPALAPCVHGHPECSMERGGPCYDEVLSRWPGETELLARPTLGPAIACVPGLAPRPASRNEPDESKA